MHDNLKSKNEEKLQEVMVGELKSHNAQITLLDYDPKWPKLFDREAKRIYSILGKKYFNWSTLDQLQCQVYVLSQLLIFYWL